MKKVVLKLDVHDEKCKQKAMKIVSSLPGLDSISVDMKEKKLTITGDIDPVAIVSKLRKIYHTEIVSVGPENGPEKKKDEPKKEEEPNKKDEPKNQAQMVQVTDLAKAFHTYPPQYYPRHYYVSSTEEDPNSCVIC